MDRFPCDAEARANKLEQLIDTRIAAIESDIFINRAAIVSAIAELCNGLNCDEDEAAALIRAAVVGRSQLVGTRIYEEVKYAIYQYALPLAEGDLADIERHRAEEAADARVDRVMWHREAA